MGTMPGVAIGRGRIVVFLMVVAMGPCATGSLPLLAILDTNWLSTNGKISVEENALLQPMKSERVVKFQKKKKIIAETGKNPRFLASVNKRLRRAQFNPRSPI